MLKTAILSISVLIISFVSVAGVFPALSYDLGVTQMQSELMLTIPALAVIIFIFISNLIAYKLGIKKTVVLGLLISAVGGVFPAFVQSFIPILISRFFLGAGVGIVNTWAVRYITLLFDEKERAHLMGYRATAEIIGQMLIAIAASFLFNFGWRWSFLAYSIAFVSALFVVMFVPNVEFSHNEHLASQQVKLPLVVYLMVAFSSLVVLTGAGVAFRFPAIAAQIRGEAYNPNTIMTFWPLLSIVASLSFGKISGVLGKKLLYLAGCILIAAAFLAGFSNGNYVLLVIALFLHGVVPAWFFPFIFMTISKFTTGKAQSLAFSYIVIGIKAGVFLIPFVFHFIETVLSTEDLTAPYPILGIGLVLAFLFIMTIGQKMVRKEIEKAQT